ncbi:MAG: NUDIX hydrolase [Candidatus Bathyarchaeota archaeon]|nr:NUDIX hydrolase [Candidatus Bathyarchaeota archaeon]MDI9578755.1 NUDIX hydrolase [Thermoproteota archaeon]
MKRLYQDHPIVGIGVVIVDQGKIVLIKRSNDPAKGKWAVPGGIVELGESTEDAVIREAKEETCLTVENPRLLDVVTQVVYDDESKLKYHHIIIDYLVDVKSGDIQAASDAAELHWVPFNQVETYDLTDSFRRFFKNNKEKIEKVSSYPNRTFLQ